MNEKTTGSLRSEGKDSAGDTPHHMRQHKPDPPAPPLDRLIKESGAERQASPPPPGLKIRPRPFEGAEKRADVKADHGERSDEIKQQKKHTMNTYPVITTIEIATTVKADNPESAVMEIHQSLRDPLSHMARYFNKSNENDRHGKEQIISINLHKSVIGQHLASKTPRIFIQLT